MPDTEELYALQDNLSKCLKPQRYKHTLGVAYTAACLAMRYGLDPIKAELAGLLHDCAKAYSTDKYIEMAYVYGIEVTDVYRANPGLLHAELGAFLSKEKYGVNDTEILSAISCHTTGKPGMTLFEKIIYIADYIEPGRNKAPRLNEIRQEAFNNIDNALVMILEDTINHIKTNGFVIDPATMETYEYYRKAI